MITGKFPIIILVLSNLITCSMHLDLLKMFAKQCKFFFYVSFNNKSNNRIMSNTLFGRKVNYFIITLNV